MMFGHITGQEACKTKSIRWISWTTLNRQFQKVKFLCVITFTRRCDVGLARIRQHLAILQNADAQFVCAAFEAQRNHGGGVLVEL